jgi:hypothetical protein
MSDRKIRKAYEQLDPYERCVMDGLVSHTMTPRRIELGINSQATMTRAPRSVLVGYVNEMVAFRDLTLALFDFNRIETTVKSHPNPVVQATLPQCKANHPHFSWMR